MQAQKFFFAFIRSILLVGPWALGSWAGFAAEANSLAELHAIAEANGVTFGAEYTGEGFANLSGGIQPGATYEGLLKLTLLLDLQRMFNWTGASAYGSAIYPAGQGLSKEYTGDLNILSNIDAYNSFRLFELWFQQNLGDHASIRIGQMSADKEFYQSEWANVFINSCFGTFPTISLGTNLPIYPVGGLGARFDFHPSAATFFRAAVFDSNPGQASTNDKHGTLFNLNPSSGVIMIAEGGYQVTPSADNGGKQESYTLGVYYDSRPFTGSFVDPTHNSNGGVYAIVDRLFFRNKPYVGQSDTDGLGGFCSCAFAPGDRNEVSFYADCGINYNGPFPGRDQDVFGLALSYTKIGRDYIVNQVPVHSGHETVLEATYQIQLTRNISLQPDLQYIFDPGAFRHQSNAIVAGVRYDWNF
jgi:porin